MKQSLGRNPRFLNQIEKRKLERLGILKEKREIHTPSNFSFPQGETMDIRIPPDQEVKEAISQALQRMKIKIKKPTKEDLKR